MPSPPDPQATRHWRMAIIPLITVGSIASLWFIIFGAVWLWLVLLVAWFAVCFFAPPWRWRWHVLGGSGTVLLLWLLMVVATIFNVWGLNTYQDGWRQGTLAEYSVSNRLLQFLPPGWVFPTGEGYLLLGDASSRGASLDGVIISPSDFSTSMAVYQRYNPLISQPVAMHFRTLRVQWMLNGETDVRVSQFEKTTAAPLPPDCTEKRDLFGSRAYGTIGGRIVEVSQVGNPLLWKTHEVIIHTGGNEFKEMSVVDSHIYQCALAALKSGQQMRITYENRLVRNPMAQNTSYNLIAIADGEAHGN